MCFQVESRVVCVCMQTEVRVGSKGVQGVLEYSRKHGFTGHISAARGATQATSVPEGRVRKHHNKHKKEKLRRIHTDLNACGLLYEDSFFFFYNT